MLMSGHALELHPPRTLSPFNVLSRNTCIFRTVCLLCVFIASLRGATAAVDISVTGIEITQAIQTPGNTITLVAGRSTAVRVTLGVTGSAVPVPNVTGHLL